MSIVTFVLVLGSAKIFAFEEDFHFYTVYYLLRAKGYPTNQAHELAGFSQYVDDNSFTEPLFCNASKRAKFHFAASSPVIATVRNCEEARRNLTNAFALYLAGKPEGKYIAGAALHLIADTFSHQTFTAWWNKKINARAGSLRPCIGHADTPEGGHAPDRPYNDPKSALGASLVIYSIVPTFPSSASLSWPTVQTNLEHVFALPVSAKENRSLEIRKKIMKDLIERQFEEKVIYDKSNFAKQKDAFVAAVTR